LLSYTKFKLLQVYNQPVCFSRKWRFYLEGVWLWRISGGC